MIGKVMHNSSFLATTRYVLEKEKASIIGGNMVGKTVPRLVKEFMLSYDLNPTIKAPVWHITLSLPHHEHLEDEQFGDLASKYYAGMILASSDPGVLKTADYEQRRNQFVQENLAEYQFFVARHSDRQHDHVHIVASRINVGTGLTVETWKDAYRSQAIIRQLEREYGLQVIPSIWETGRKAKSKSQLNKQEVTGQDTVKAMLQQQIDAAASDHPTMPVLIARLQECGIDVRVHYVDDRKAKKAGNPNAQKVQGISYSLNGVSVSGSDLGMRYSFKGLQKQQYAGVSYDPDRDDELIKTLMQQPVEVVSSPENGLPASKVEDHATDGTAGDAVDSGSEDTSFTVIGVQDEGAIAPSEELPVPKDSGKVRDGKRLVLAGEEEAQYPESDELLDANAVELLLEQVTTSGVQLSEEELELPGAIEPLQIDGPATSETIGTSEPNSGQTFAAPVESDLPEKEKRQQLDQYRAIYQSLVPEGTAHRVSRDLAVLKRAIESGRYDRKDLMDLISVGDQFLSISQSKGQDAAGQYANKLLRSIYSTRPQKRRGQREFDQEL